jgi:hypothetical protein
MMRVKQFIALLAVAGALVTVGTAAATRPLTQFNPLQAVCEAQGGTFQVAVDFRSVYCAKEGALFTVFSESQLAVQRTICERVYGAFFGVQGELPNTTSTFCTTSA